MTYKLKVCQICGKEYQPTSSTQKYCVDCRREVRHETDHIRNVKYYLVHSSLDPVRREKHRLYNITYKATRHEILLGQHVVYNVGHPDVGTKWQREHPEEQRAVKRRSSSKRRTLGFIPDNQPFIGCAAHHVDHDHVLYIPSELHKSVGHNVWTGYNMDKINTLTFQWLERAACHVQ